MTKQFPALHQMLESGDYPALRTWLAQESNLPGPRANLGLILAFADACGNRPSDTILPVFEAWLSLPIVDAPVNSPAEFPLACAAAAVAAMLPTASNPGDFERLLARAARDVRWRTREGVVLGAQRAGERDPEPIVALAERWGTSADPLLERAAIAILGHTPLLRDRTVSLTALDVCDVIFARLRSCPADLHRTEPHRVLEKGLSYAISMFVAAVPEVGFARMERWIANSNGMTRRIVRANLGKARIARKYPEEVIRLKAVIENTRD